MALDTNIELFGLTFRIADSGPHNRSLRSLLKLGQGATYLLYRNNHMFYTLRWRTHTIRYRTLTGTPKTAVRAHRQQAKRVAGFYFKSTFHHLLFSSSVRVLLPFPRDTSTKQYTIRADVPTIRSTVRVLYLFHVIRVYHSGRCPNYYIS